MRLEAIELYCAEPYARTKEFYQATNAVVDLYQRCLGKLQTGSIGKVGIVLLAPDAKPLPVDVDEDVLSVYVPLDVDALLDEDDGARRGRVLDLVHKALLKAATARKWDAAPFRAARACAVEYGLVNEEFVGAVVPSPNRERKAQLFYDFGTTHMEVLVVVTTPDGEEVRRLPIARFSAHGGRAMFSDLLGKLKWLSDTELQLTTKDGGKKRIKVAAAKAKR